MRYIIHTIYCHIPQVLRCRAGLSRRATAVTSRRAIVGWRASQQLDALCVDIHRWLGILAAACAHYGTRRARARALKRMHDFKTQRCRRKRAFRAATSPYSGTSLMPLSAPAPVGFKMPKSARREIGAQARGAAHTAKARCYAPCSPFHCRHYIA